MCIDDSYTLPITLVPWLKNLKENKINFYRCKLNLSCQDPKIFLFWFLDLYCLFLFTLVTLLRKMDPTGLVPTSISRNGHRSRHWQVNERLSPSVGGVIQVWVWLRVSVHGGTVLETNFLKLRRDSTRQTYQRDGGWTTGTGGDYLGPLTVSCLLPFRWQEERRRSGGFNDDNTGGK